MMKDNIMAREVGRFITLKAKVRVKAWICFTAAILLAALGVEFPDSVGEWGFLAAGCFLAAAMVCWRMERPRDVSFPGEEGNDPGKLHRSRWSGR